MSRQSMTPEQVECAARIYQTLRQAIAIFFWSDSSSTKISELLRFHSRLLRLRFRCQLLHDLAFTLTVFGTLQAEIDE